MSSSLDGRCTCAAVRFRLLDAPLIVHACHCTWCQRETGSAFVLNAVIEAARLSLVAGAPEAVSTPSASGRGQPITRCPRCRVALWSYYSSPRLRFVRVGTLDEPWRCPPDVHIFTSTKLPWVVLPPGTPAFAEFYEDRAAVWSPAALARLAAVMAG